MTKHALLKAVRLTHLYFASSSLQLCSSSPSPDSSRPSPSTKPPAELLQATRNLVKLGNIHKKATLPGPPRPEGPKPEAPKPQGPTAHDASPAQPKTPPPPQSFHWPEKIFFGIVAIGLISSTLTGLYMSWMFARRKVFIVVTFIAGAILPLILLRF